MTKADYLREPIRHIDITAHNVVSLVEAMGAMSYSARDLARAANIYDRMLRDRDCGGHPLPRRLAHQRRPQEGLRRHDPQPHGRRGRQHGANIVDQDFFEALGFRHYIADGAAERPAWTTRCCVGARSTGSTTPSSTRTSCGSATRPPEDRRRARAAARTPPASSSGRWGRTCERAGLPAEDSIVLAGVPERTCPSSAPRSATARRASASSPTRRNGASRPRSASTRSRISTS